MKSSYYISLLVPDVSLEDYTAQAHEMARCFERVVKDRASIAEVTDESKLGRCHTELDVMLQDRKLLGRALLEMESDATTSLRVDTTRLRSAFEHAAPWRDLSVAICRVERRAGQHDGSPSETSSTRGAASPATQPSSKPADAPKTRRVGSKQRRSSAASGGKPLQPLSINRMMQQQGDAALSDAALSC